MVSLGSKMYYNEGKLSSKKENIPTGAVSTSAIPFIIYAQNAHCKLVQY